MYYNTPIIPHPLLPKDYASNTNGGLVLEEYTYCGYVGAVLELLPHLASTSSSVLQTSQPIPFQQPKYPVFLPCYHRTYYLGECYGRALFLKFWGSVSQYWHHSWFDVFVSPAPAAIFSILIEINSCLKVAFKKCTKVVTFQNYLCSLCKFPGIFSFLACLYINCI